MVGSKEKRIPGRRRWIFAAISGTILSIALILVTLEIIRRGLIPFFVTQQKYIISAEAALIGVFLTEIIARVLSHIQRSQGARVFGSRFRIMVRVTGYLIAGVSIISILAANPTLGISIGAIAGVVIAFATQNLIGNVLSAVMIMNTHIIRVGEEVNLIGSVTGVRGKVTDINLIHTVIQIDDDVIFVPNSVIMSSAVKRKKRTDTIDVID